MNERIDVLAVMGHLAYALQHSPKAVEQINEARAAVAELIEAGADIRRSAGKDWRGSDRFYVISESDYSGLCAALARAGAP